MKVPYFDLTRQYKQDKKEIDKAVHSVLSSGRLILGNNVNSFEEEFKNYNNSKHAIGVASGSDALLLSLMALNIKPGDEVITTPFTFIATATCITRLGAKPVFVDIRKDTFNIDENKIENAITRRTKAIIPVHLYGQMSKMDHITAIALKHNIPIIEDCCQSVGSEHKRVQAGNYGLIGCFSFYPTKNLGTAGDGGMIETNNDKLAKKLRMLRAHGADNKYVHQLRGINSRLDELQAAMLRIKLRKLEKRTEKRISNAQTYSNSIQNFKTPITQQHSRHVFNNFSILSNNREKLMTYLEKKGIGSCIHYPIPLHLQPCFSYLKYKKGDFPVSEDISKKVLSIPIFPELKKEEQDHVINTLNSFSP